VIPGFEANNQYRPIGSSTWVGLSKTISHVLTTPDLLRGNVYQSPCCCASAQILFFIVAGSEILPCWSIKEALTSDVLIIRISVSEVSDGDPAHLAGAMMMSVRYRDKLIVMTQHCPQTENVDS